MKRNLKFGVALATSLSVSAAFAGGPEVIITPDYFTGFYVGGTVAVHAMDADQSAVYTSSPTAGVIPTFAFTNAGAPTAISLVAPGAVFSSIDSNGASFDIYGGVQGGFNQVFNHRWLLGVVGFWEGGSQSSKTSSQQSNVFSATTVNSFGDTFTSTGLADVNMSTTVQIANDYGVAGKLGYVATPTTLIYGKIGAIWADISSGSTVAGTVSTNTSATTVFSPGVSPTDSVASNVSVGGSTTNEQTKVAVLLGIGMEQFIFRDWISVNLEYDYANFGTVNAGPVNVAANGTATGATSGGTVVTPAQAINNAAFGSLSSSARAKISTFMAGVNFYFHPGWL